MATRGVIAYMDNGVLNTSYNHYDSYPSYLGKVLDKYFLDPEGAKELATSGDIRFIDLKTGEVERFKDGKRSKKLNLSQLDPEDASEEIAMLIDSYGADYAYFYNKSDNSWDVVKNGGIRSMLDPIKNILYSDYENEEDRMELDETLVRQFKRRAGIIK